ncbi:hypothetical protein [Coprobacter tertius]|uniref:DUF4252 domain-containing protein n=1 Tax=Coprobacter tertius TaxID=2944915 RepID=A0ABT1MEY3_9BACT|nr:hypothetical protein [Coprobacter tertius]MCP9611182.1 hypothetical protein [Coprobacter tertius]
MKKLLMVSIVFLLSAITLSAKGIAKTFHEKQQGISPALYQHITDKDSLLNGITKEEMSEDEYTKTRYLYENTDELDIFFAMLPDDDPFGSLFSEESLPAGIKDMNNVQYNITNTIISNNGDTISNNIKSGELDPVREETNRINNEALLKKLLSKYDNLLRFHKDNIQYSAFSKGKRKTINKMVLLIKFDNMFVIMEFAGKWKEKKLLDILTDEDINMFKITEN